MKSWIHLGPGKSGSTWLYKFALANSDLFVVPKIKETQCFHSSSVNFHEFFKDPLQSNKIYCDFSNTYIFNPLAAQHLLSFYETNSNHEVIFTVLLRCPVERSISHFSYLKASGSISPEISFEEHISSDPSILWRSRYELHLSFLMSQGLPIKVFLLETQSSYNPELVNQVTATLLHHNYSSTYNIPDKSSRFSSMDSRNIYASRCAKSMSEALRRHGHLAVLSFLKENRYVRSLFMKPKSSKITLDNQTLIILQSFFKPTLAFIGSLGLDCTSHWPKSVEL